MEAALTCVQPDGLVAARKVAVKVRDKGVAIVVPRELDPEGRRERQVLHLHCVHVDRLQVKGKWCCRQEHGNELALPGRDALPATATHSQGLRTQVRHEGYQDRAEVGNDRVLRHSVHQRLQQRDVLDAAHVKAVHVVPDWPSKQHNDTTHKHRAEAKWELKAQGIAGGCEPNRYDMPKITKPLWRPRSNTLEGEMGGGGSDRKLAAADTHSQSSLPCTSRLRWRPRTASPYRGTRGRRG